MGIGHVFCCADTPAIQGELDGSSDIRNGTPDPGGKANPILNLLALGGLKTANTIEGIDKPQLAKAKRRASQVIGYISPQLMSPRQIRQQYTTIRERYSVQNVHRDLGLQFSAAQRMKFNSITPQNCSVKSKILHKLISKCQDIGSKNIDFYKLQENNETHLQELIDCLNKDRQFKTTLSGVIFSELISAGKGIYLVNFFYTIFL